MTDRLSEIDARINGIRELGTVVNAMRGIAGARAQQARSGLVAVGLYAENLASAIGRALTLLPGASSMQDARGRVVVLFLAEQGFAGAFSERLLDAAADELTNTEAFLVGTRGASLADERGIKFSWREAMPAHPVSIPRFADRIAGELYARIADGTVGRLEAWFARDGLEKRQLFPLDTKSFARDVSGDAPLLNVQPAALLANLTADYIHAQLCDAALNAFAAENEARMEAMASAHREIDRELGKLQMRQRIVRQDEITAEIIELAAGAAAQTPDI